MAEPTPLAACPLLRPCDCDDPRRCRSIAQQVETSEGETIARLRQRYGRDEQAWQAWLDDTLYAESM
jgi:hypothetical protein